MRHFPKLITDKELLQQIHKIIKKYLPNAKIYVYGSYVNGNFNVSSDLDILIKNKQKISLTKYGKIINAIEDLPTMRMVDIVDFHMASKDFLEVILPDCKDIEKLI